MADLHFELVTPDRMVTSGDVYMVVIPGTEGESGIMAGHAPGADAGVDTGPVTNQRLYQLIRQKGPVRDRTFSIEFLDPGVEAFSFTFG